MDDLEFIKRCVKAEKIAWEEFLQKYGSLIYSYIHNTLRIKGFIFEPSVIQEIFNEIISSLIKDDYKKLKSFKGRNSASLATWLRQVTINFCLSYLRKKRPASISLDATVGDGLALSEVIPSRSLSPAEELMRKENTDQLTDCIQKLELDDRFFLELRLNWDFSHEELKDFLAVSRPAVDMRYSRILERLRDCFREKGFRLPRDEES